MRYKETEIKNGRKNAECCSVRRRFMYKSYCEKGKKKRIE